MDISARFKILLTSGFVALALVFGITGSAFARNVVTFATGIVEVEKDGTVVVVVKGEVLVPSNGQGLLRGGQIEPGERVGVKIVQDKGRKHRGHVTVLK